MSDLSAETAALLDAELLLRTRDRGMLATISRRIAGWPFGSVVPYALDREGRPIILIANIAEHTKNIAGDDRVSLLVQEATDGEDVQAKGRLTLMGRAARIPEEEITDAAPRYRAKVSSADEYFATHDFAFYRIGVEHLRYIGGFGEIFWLDPNEYRARVADDPIERAAKPIIDHMNDDHEEAMSLWCRAFLELAPQHVRMAGVDRWGADLVLTTPDARVRIDFKEAATPDSIRRIVVAMTAEARALLQK